MYWATWHPDSAAATRATPAACPVAMAVRAFTWKNTRSTTTDSGLFEEVNLGYNAELAKQEAQRCLECAKPTCTDNCPVGVKVKEFVELIVTGDFLAAAAKIREDNVLPAVTGRVCPQEDQCEGKCLLSKKVKPLASATLSALLRITNRGWARPSFAKPSSQERKSPWSAVAPPDSPSRAI